MPTTPLFFIDNAVDRSSDVRSDDAVLGAMRRADDARYLVVRRGRVLAERGAAARIAWRRLAELEEAHVDVSTIAFLGRLDGQPRFAVIPTEVPVTADDRFLAATDDDDFVGLRRAAMTMPATEAQMAGHAVHLSNWINRNRYCGSCAAPMRLCDAGHKLQCSGANCTREEFPRTDPVVITLVTRQSRCFLARQPKFPPRFYSALAGFVEPGETLEAAVQREVLEETSMDIRNVTYVGSQPWPFPTSLMVGYLAEATGEAFVLDQRELEDGCWLDRSEVAKLSALASDAQSSVLLPAKGVMARRLIEVWLSRT